MDFRPATSHSARSATSQANSEYDLGYGSTTYIAAAQKHMDSGNTQECLKIIRNGIEIGAKPKQLLLTAHKNALNGMKKLMAIPSAKKTTKPQIAKQNGSSGERKSGTIQLESSEIYKSRKRLRNLGAPIPPVKHTPKASHTKKLCLKKLEESPLLMSYLDSPATPHSYHRMPFNQGKCNQSPFVMHKFGKPRLTFEENKMGKDPIPSDLRSQFEEKLKDKDNLPLAEKEPIPIAEKDDQTFREKVYEKENMFYASMTEPSSVKKGSKVDEYESKYSSKTMQPSSSHKSVTRSNKQPAIHREICSGLKKSMNTFCIEGNALSIACKEETTQSSHSSFSGSLSEFWSSITDQTFPSEKIRCNSDSGYQEAGSNKMAIPATYFSSKKKEGKCEESSRSKTHSSHIHYDGMSGIKGDDNRPPIRDWRYNDTDAMSGASSPKSENYDFKKGIENLFDHIPDNENLHQDCITKVAKEEAKVSRIEESEFKGSGIVRSHAIVVSECDNGQSLNEHRDDWLCQKKLNLSGIAEISNLSINEDKLTSSTASSGTLVSSYAANALSALSTNTITSSQTTINADTSQRTVQPFKVPFAPAPKPNQTDHHKAKIGHQNQHLEYLSSKPVIDQSQGNLSISSYLMKVKHDAEAAKAKSQSTTKKHKIIRIKKERYKVISILGKGGSSKVYEVGNDDGKIFAMKCVPLEDLDDFVFESHCNEIEILWTLRSDPYIIKLHEYEIKNEKLFMLMEKGEMDLEKYLHLNRKMESEEIRNLWLQMLCAVKSIHKQGIIHTDLKPANFLFVDSALKLIDFGIAKGLQENCTSTQRDCLIGTLNYMAPESVSESTYERAEYGGSKKNYKIRRATDIWSLGCILYLMVYGKTPFQHIQPKALKVAAITGGPEIAFADIDNKDLLDTIKGCLKRNPSQRYTIDQLLAHPFVSKGESPVIEKNDEENYGPLKRMDPEIFLQHVSESSINSPNALQRTQKSLTKRGLLEQAGANTVRKAIF